MLKKKKNIKTLVLVCDSICWKASVTNVKEKKLVLVNSINILPEELLEWGKSVGAKAVKILIPADLSLVELPDLDDAFDNYEIHDALLYEVADQEGIEADQFQLTTLKTDSLNLGMPAKSWIVSAMKRSLILQYQEACDVAGLTFSGVGSFQQSVLSYLAQQSEFQGTAFVELDAMSGFVAVPAQKGKEALIRQLTAGLPPEDDVLHDAWGQRLARRMNAVKDLPVTMLTTNSNLTEFKEHVSEFLPKIQVNLLSLDDYIDKLVATIEASKPYDLKNLSLADLPPKAKDPRTTATYIGLTMFLLLGIALGSNWVNLQNSIEVYEKRIEMNKELKTARESAAAKVASIEKQLQQTRAQYSFLLNNRHFDDSLRIVLGYIARDLPEYSRLESVSYDNGKIKLQLVTLWQQEVNTLINNLSSHLKGKRLLIVPGNITKSGKAFFYDIDISRK